MHEELRLGRRPPPGELRLEPAETDTPTAHRSPERSAGVEASGDLGASALTTMRRVTLPVILPAVIAGALLAFTLSVDEFIIAFFTAWLVSRALTRSTEFHLLNQRVLGKLGS